MLCLTSKSESTFFFFFLSVFFFFLLLFRPDITGLVDWTLTIKSLTQLKRTRVTGVGSSSTRRKELVFLLRCKTAGHFKVQSFLRSFYFNLSICPLVKTCVEKLKATGLGDRSGLCMFRGEMLMSPACGVHKWSCLRLVKYRQTSPVVHEARF